MSEQTPEERQAIHERMLGELEQRLQALPDSARDFVTRWLACIRLCGRAGGCATRLALDFVADVAELLGLTVLAERGEKVFDQTSKGKY